MLDYLIVNRKIDNHKIQPKPPIKAPNPIIPELPKADLPPITITGGEVTINFHWVGIELAELTKTAT